MGVKQKCGTGIQPVILPLRAGRMGAHPFGSLARLDARAARRVFMRSSVRRVLLSPGGADMSAGPTVSASRMALESSMLVNSIVARAGAT